MLDSWTWITRQLNYPQSAGNLRTSKRSSGNGTESNHFLHLLGTERLEESAETQCAEGLLRQDVRHDAAVQLFLMKRKGVDSLESLRSQALAQGVEFIACQMSMDMMGIQHEELLDEVTIGGVATYMERADKANVNLFI